jgi:hypothetical protein
MDGGIQCWWQLPAMPYDQATGKNSLPPYQIEKPARRNGKDLPPFGGSSQAS